MLVDKSTYGNAFSNQSRLNLPCILGISESGDAYHFHAETELMGGDPDEDVAKKLIMWYAKGEDRDFDECREHE